MRRHVSPAFLDFDLRANGLVRPPENADERAKEQYQKDRSQLGESLAFEFGSMDIERKIDDFLATGALPPSIISYHNALLRQVRAAFACGHYYPALTGACALGERILNHLVLDLREDFRSSDQYKQVHRKDSFQDWELAISVLESWNVLLSEVASAFRKLATLRHRSLHFNSATYVHLREDGIAAIKELMTIVGHQFSAFGISPWFIDGSRGSCFIKQTFESDPFVRRYYLPLCPKVGPRFAWLPTQGTWIAFDFERYQDERTVTDDEFRDLYNKRDPNSLAPTTLPLEPGITCQMFVTRSMTAKISTP